MLNISCPIYFVTIFLVRIIFVLIFLILIYFVQYFLSNNVLSSVFFPIYCVSVYFVLLPCYSIPYEICLLAKNLGILKNVFKTFLMQKQLQRFWDSIIQEGVIWVTGYYMNWYRHFSLQDWTQNFSFISAHFGFHIALIAFRHHSLTTIKTNQCIMNVQYLVSGLNIKLAYPESILSRYNQNCAQPKRNLYVAK